MGESVFTIVKSGILSYYENGVRAQAEMWTDWNEVTFPHGTKMVSSSFIKGLFGDVIEECRSIEHFKETYQIRNLSVSSYAMLIATINLLIPRYEIRT